MVQRKGMMISDRTWKGHQSWNREVIENVGGRRIRFSIKVDSYDFQSWARAEVWNGDKWNVIHSIAGQEIKSFKKVSYVSRTCSPTVFDEDLKELRSVTNAVLL